MKYRLSGLLVILIAAACVCLLIVSPEMDSALQITLIVVAVIFVITGSVILKKESEKTADQVPEAEAPEARYEKKNSLMTVPEARLFIMLRQLFGGKYEILPQVALVSLVDKLTYASYRNELFRVVDFVITDLNFKPLVVVELNDKSHLRADRVERDKKVATILEKARLPLVVLTQSDSESPNVVRRAIASKIRH